MAVLAAKSVVVALPLVPQAAARVVLVLVAQAVVGVHVEALVVRRRAARAVERGKQSKRR